MKNYILILSLITLISCEQKVEIEDITSSYPKFENLSIRALETYKNEVVIGASNSTFAYSSDYGKTWKFKILDTLKREFRSIAIDKNQILIANVGSPSTILRSIDRGENWDTVYVNNSPVSFINSMKISEKIALASGDPISENKLNVIISRDQGLSWNSIDSLLPDIANGEAQFAASNTNIKIVDDKIWIVTGGKLSSVFKSENLGQTWNKIEPGFTEGKQMKGIYSVNFKDEKNGIIFGGDWNEVENSKKNKFITKDGGISWQESKGAIGYHSCVQYLSAQKLLALGKEGLSISEDAGLSWSKISNYKDLYTFRLLENGTILAAGKGKLVEIKGLKF